MGDEHLKNRNLLLHADGARAHKLRIPGVLHDDVARVKKKVAKQGSTIWIQSKFSNMVNHEFPSGETVRVKSGTQIMNRFWSHLRTHFGKRTRRVDTIAMRRRVRSAQWTHWNKGRDLWARTGDMLQELY
ncbi:unnamed protein product [Prorocentrum cordatum]|uniref:Uncharacterized protein n=1 Tax=Prorocentrum cordatum TaxID=2364126 RepID=A0ABN9T6P7_9DINO|nr:unnamed protein product [Polarella glacialis]